MARSGFDGEIRAQSSCGGVGYERAAATGGPVIVCVAA